MPRAPREVSPSKIYHVMIRGNEKKNIFSYDSDKEKFIKILHEKKDKIKYQIYAYCLMDNHVHLLINEKNDSVSTIMKCINISYAMYFNKRYNRTGHLFQDRFKSEVVNEENYLLALVRYIHQNPIKANMVSNLLDYRWSSYRSYIRPSRIEQLVDTNFVLDMLSEQRKQAIQQFIRFSNERDDRQFLDIEGSDKEIIKTKEEAMKFINEFLGNRGMSIKELDKHRGKIKGTIKHQLVCELKKKSSLGYRSIGDILGISKSTVQKLK